MIIKTSFGDMPLIYEDNHIVVISKPHGLHSVEDRNKSEKETVRSLMDKHYGKIYMVHRLDAGTGGVMVCAKNASAHSALCKQFEEETVIKVYWAVTKGVMLYPVSVLLPISSKISHGKYKINFTSGKEASTMFFPMDSFEERTLVKAYPITGRTHQIRVHLRALKHPLYKDWVYNKPIDDRRLTLFSKVLIFLHPVTNNKQTFTTNLSEFMLENLEGIDFSE